MTREPDTRPMLASPVYPSGNFLPRWMRAKKSLPKYFWEFTRGLSEIFDHHGESIVDGRRAFVSEPYARGRPDYLELAVHFAGITETDLRISLKTWHGFGTMRFAWLAPQSVVIPRHLQQFVDFFTLASEIMRRLIDTLPPPSDCEVKTLRDGFWRPLWRELPAMSQAEHDWLRSDGDSLLAWHGYRTRRETTMGAA